MVSEITIELLSPKGKQQIQVDLQAGIKELRQQVGQQLDTPAEKCCLIAKGKILADSSSLKEAKLDEPGARLFVAFDDPAKEEEAAKSARRNRGPADHAFAEPFERLRRQIGRKGEAGRVDEPAENRRRIQEMMEKQKQEMLETTGERNQKTLDDFKRRMEFNEKLHRQMLEPLLRQAGGGISGEELQKRLLDWKMHGADPDFDGLLVNPLRSGDSQAENPMEGLERLMSLLQSNSQDPTKEEMESMLKRLSEMGFTEDEGLKVLSECDYKLEDAVEKLMTMQKSS